MPVTDEMDGFVDKTKIHPTKRRVDGSRWVVYLQLVALIPSVIIGRSELLQGEQLRPVFEIAFMYVGWSSFLFPVAAFVLILREGAKQVPLSWAAVPCSLAMSFAQLLAILPLIQ